MGLSHSLDTPDCVFSPFSTFDRQSALAETLRTRDLVIFVMTTTTTMTQAIIVYPFAHAHGVISKH